MEKTLAKDAKLAKGENSSDAEQTPETRARAELEAQCKKESMELGALANHAKIATVFSKFFSPSLAGFASFARDPVLGFHARHPSPLHGAPSPSPIPHWRKRRE